MRLANYLEIIFYLSVFLLEKCNFDRFPKMW